MRLFIDASAAVAIVENESDRPVLAAKLRLASRRFWSAMSCWEAVSALQRSYERPVDVARETIANFAEEFDFELVPIGAAELSLALDAYEKFGKGRHRAQLNFGDCFAYACAKTNDARLLYKGEDFAQTDLA